MQRKLLSKQLKILSRLTEYPLAAHADRKALLKAATGAEFACLRIDFAISIEVALQRLHSGRTHTHTNTKDTNFKLSTIQSKKIIDTIKCTPIHFQSARLLTFCNAICTE